MVSFSEKLVVLFWFVYFFMNLRSVSCFLWSVRVLPLPKISFAKSYLSRPGFEPLLPRPLRSALTTTPSGLEEYMNRIDIVRAFVEALLIFFNNMPNFRRSPVGTAFLGYCSVDFRGVICICYGLFIYILFQ